MAKNLISKAVRAVTRCQYCKGSGRVEYYIQGCNEITKGGRVVGHTTCTTYKTCPHCGGSGRGF